MSRPFCRSFSDSYITPQETTCTIDELGANSRQDGYRQRRCFTDSFIQSVGVIEQTTAPSVNLSFNAAQSIDVVKLLEPPALFRTGTPTSSECHHRFRSLSGHIDASLNPRDTTPPEGATQQLSKMRSLGDTLTTQPLSRYSIFPDEIFWEWDDRKDHVVSNDPILDEKNDGLLSLAQHKHHIFVITATGKPVFSRYHDPVLLNSVTAIFAMLNGHLTSSFFQRLDQRNKLTKLGSSDGGAIQSVVVRRCNQEMLTLSFLQYSSLIFVTVSRRPYLPPWMTAKEQQRFYSQIVSILTEAFLTTLESRPSFDLRTILSFVDVKLLRTLMARQRRDLALTLSAIEPLRLSPAHRHIAHCALQNVTTSAGPVMLGILLAGSRVVVLSVSKYLPLDALVSEDLSCLIMLVMTAKSLRMSENWVPFCLPHYNSKFFLTMYVHYIEDPVAVVYLSGSSSTNQFAAISHYVHSKCIPMLKKSGCLTAILHSLACCPYTIAPSLCKTTNVIHVAYCVSKAQVLTPTHTSQLGFISADEDADPPLTLPMSERYSNNPSLCHSPVSSASPLARCVSEPSAAPSKYRHSAPSSAAFFRQTRVQQVYSSALMSALHVCARDTNRKKLKRIIHLYKLVLSMQEDCPKKALPVQIHFQTQREKVFCVLGRSTQIFCCTPHWTDFTTETLRLIFSYLRQEEASTFFTVSHLSHFS